MKINCLEVIFLYFFQYQVNTFVYQRVRSLNLRFAIGCVINSIMF
jgi:hypothetical protein